MAMREPDQQEFGFVEPRNHRLRRGVYLLPSAFTVGNLLCGFYAVLATVKGEIVDLDYAARAIGFAIVFDAFDGFVARATSTNTEFGKQLDSLADMVSFGIAPAILAYTWGVRTIAQSDIPEARHIYDLAWLVSLAFALCCAWRLARFNVQGMAPGRAEVFCGNAVPGGGRNDRGGGTRMEGTHRGLALVGRMVDAGAAARRAYGEHDPLLQLQSDSLGKETAFTDHRCRRLIGVVDCGVLGDRTVADRR